MALKDEIPDTEQGLKNYVSYSEHEIKECGLRVKRLTKAMQMCMDRLKEIEEQK